MTISEENYLKVIYHLSLVSPKGVNTNAIAGMLDTKASSVTDMLKKLSEKDLVAYQKYQGVTLTENGFRSAKMIVRKHRLGEVFLVEKLGFAWDEVHDIAEELELRPEQLAQRINTVVCLQDPEASVKDCFALMRDTLLLLPEKWQAREEVKKILDNLS